MASRLQETGRVNQAEAAQIIGMSARAFREFEKRVGLVPDALDGTEKLYLASEVHFARLSEKMGNAPKAGTVLSGDGAEAIDVDWEKAQKLKAERIGQEIKNAEALGELAPIEMLTSVLGDVSQMVNSWLEGIPAQIKRVWPEVSGSVLDMIERECAKTRNGIADARIVYTDPRMQAHSSDPENA